MSKIPKYRVNPNLAFDPELYERPVRDIWSRVEQLLTRRKGVSESTLRSHMPPEVFEMLECNLLIKRIT